MVSPDLTQAGEIKELGGAKFVHCSRRYGADYRDQMDFLDRVWRDLAAVVGVEYRGQETRLWEISTDTVRDAAYQLLERADLTGGYHGIRRAEDAGGPVEERFEIF